MNPPPASIRPAASVTPRYEVLRERALACHTTPVPRDLAVLLSRGVAAWMRSAPASPPGAPTRVAAALPSPGIVRVLTAMTLAHAPHTEMPA